MQAVWVFIFFGGVLSGACAAVLSLLLIGKKDFFYWRKYLLSIIHLTQYKRRTEKKLSVYKNLSKADPSPTELGIFPTTFEYEVENPRGENPMQHFDGVHFFGVDKDENMIDVCINKVSKNVASVWLILKLSNDGWYQLPSTEDSRRAYIDSSHMFCSSGLQIRCLNPLRKWRISFNGLLSKHSNETGDTSELVHVKFSFIWLSMSIVQERNVDFDVQQVAEAFANANQTVTSDEMDGFNMIQNRYEQWGQLMGTVNVKDRDEKELYLWSMRTRIFDNPYPSEKDFSFIKLFMHFQEGFPLKLECLTVEDFITNYTDGYSIAGAGGILNLSNINLETQNLDPSSFPRKMKIAFYLQGKLKTLSIRYSEEKTQFSVGDNLQSTMIIKPFKARMEDMVGFGVIHCGFKSEKMSDEHFSLPPMILSDKGLCNNQSNLVLSLSSEACQSSHVSGGKGCSLSLLTKLAEETNQFIVPKGFVITTRAFEQHIKNNSSVQLAICQLNDVLCEKKQGDLKEECLKCVSEFASSTLCSALVTEIESALCTEFEHLDNVRFSVRSSACGEDSEDLSAAGQMLTILGIRGMKNVTDAVVKCWSSKFAFEAVQYARQNGQSIHSSMAVVIQEMVPAEIAGVMFTVDPVTGDPTYPCITANYGLGETVVSSSAEPDTIILKRNFCNGVSVAEKKIGSKETQVFMKDGHGVEEKHSEDRSNISCLSDELAAKIGEVGLLIEECFCGPRDIEFAVSKGKLFLLQARPITTLHIETDFELIHDQDNPIRSEYEYWTRANTGEVFLGAASPLGISLVVGLMDLFAQRNQVLHEKGSGLVFCPYYCHMLPVTHRQVTISLVDTLFRNNLEEVSNTQKAFEVGIFGRIIGNKDMHRAGVRKYGYLSTFRKMFGRSMLLLALFRGPKLIDILDKKVQKYRLPMETYTTAAKTWEGIIDQFKLYIEVCAVHGLATFMSTLYNVQVLSILARGKKEWDNELYCDFATLLSSCSDVESADVPSSLQELAKSIAQVDGQTFSSLDPEHAYNLLKNDEGLSGKLFKNFLEKHGHRCIKEFDLYSVSWGMKPEKLIPTLQNMVKSPTILDSKPKVETTIEDSIAKLKTPLSSFSKFLLKFVLPWSRKGVGQREKSKSMMIKTVDWFRQSCHHLGKMMVQEGMLPKSELVFFLTLDEIKEMLETQRPGLVPKAVRRLRLHPMLDALQFPEIIIGIPRPIKEEISPEQFSSSFTLTGTPVCQGTIKGIAKVILTLDEASSIENGDILITHATDTGWSPYFPLLSGVVTVLGGLISHGAVVAREYGLPCIVGVKGATTAFKSGDMIILDGTKGTVTKVEKN